MSHYLPSQQAGSSLGASTAHIFHFGEFTLDQSRYRLQRGERLLRLERRPMELLFLLVERHGELVTRKELADRLWGSTVFVDIDQSINTAVRKVRLALRDDPDKPRFVETVVGKGYRFAAAVTVNGEATASPTTGLSSNRQHVPLSENTVSAVAPTEHNRKRPFVLKLMAGAVAVLAILTSGWLAIDIHRAGSAAQPAIKSLAVLPLKNLSGDPGQEYLADGMTEALISRLSGIHGLRVISRTSAMRLKDTKLSLPEIAKTLQADAVVEGSVIRQGNRIRVTAQLIRGSSDQHFWSEVYDRELPDVLALQSDVAQAIARKIEVTLTGKERERLAAAHAIAPEVYESYLKGHFEFYNASTDAGFERSIAYFAEAIKKDPSFAPAYVGLGNAYMQLDTALSGALPEKERAEAVSAARTALQLEPDLAEAHVLLADVYEEQWRWAEAETEYRRAIDLNPNDGNAHAALAIWFLSRGRTEEALALMRRGRELDPVSVHGTDVGLVLFCSRRYDDAIREYQNVLAFKPDALGSLSQLGMTLTLTGQPEQAIPLLEKAVSVSARSPDIVAALIVAHAHAGRRSDALRLLAELKRRKQSGYVPAGAFVTAYIGLGDNEEAFEWLERAYKERCGLLQLVKVHPLLDPLRGDPRFADLIRRVGLE
jgi:TolB-like protein/DNA-binding winged helix-turn-helix (wHTH) protein/Flp pilus assembly protein TadD